jgi:aspartate aminotransferase
MKRNDGVQAINAAIGNVTLPMHPAMQERMFSLSAPRTPFHTGVVSYTATVGAQETIDAFLNILRSSRLSTDDLCCQITDGGSQAMELVLLDVCEPRDQADRPLLVIDPAYSNYSSMAERTRRRTVSVSRHLQEDGTFELPDVSMIEQVITKEHPSALLIIPYDNPTGQFFSQQMINQLAELCVKHNIWLVSDEAYLELFAQGEQVSSIWAISEDDVPGIRGRRISIESASKVWNACGLRIGALITDNREFHHHAVSENTANLCSNAIGQYIFGALAHQRSEELREWYVQQRQYYTTLSAECVERVKLLAPELIAQLQQQRCTQLLICGEYLAQMTLQSSL